MSEYDKVVKGSLRLRSDSGIKKKKKKQKITVVKENVPKTEPQDTQEPTADKVLVVDNSKLTKSQRQFEKQKDKRIIERALSEAHKSHKQRIMDLNIYLGTLTEHFDIQKVSWTK